MGKCRNCGADRQEEHIFCPICGKPLAVTVKSYAVARRKLESVFFQECAKRKDVPNAVRKVCARASWETADWRYGDRLEGRAQDDELHDSAMDNLTTVRLKAEKMFRFLVDG